MVFVHGEAVDTDDHLVTFLHSLLVAIRALLDLALYVAALDGDECAAHVVYPFDVGPRLALDLVGEVLDKVTACQRVNRVGHARFVGDDLLRAQGNLHRLLGGQA